MMQKKAFRSSSPKRQIVAIVVLVVLAGAALVANDLWGSGSTNLRQFDPDQVAALETQMWRSYYARERLSLYDQLTVLLRRQYHLPFLRSYVVAFHAAKAAFVFKDGNQRSDYERALPDLIDYYAALRRISSTPFDVDRAAHLELEWWIIHRQRASHAAGDLDNALAALAAEVYQTPAPRFAEHAKYRAEAMTLRDEHAEHEGVSEA